MKIRSQVQQSMQVQPLSHAPRGVFVQAACRPHTMLSSAEHSPEMRPRGGQLPLSSTMTASNCHAVRGFSDASSSTAPCVNSHRI